MNILIVDDDQSTVECIRASIDWNALSIKQVFTAHSKGGAMAILETQQVDIVLCDIEMPMGSGLDLLAEVRLKNLTCDFIFLTCHDNFSFAKTAIDYKVASYILKPFNPDRVVEELKNVILNREKQIRITETSKYGEYWLNNREDIERNFWTDIIQSDIPLNYQSLQNEAIKRGLSNIRVQTPYSLLLLSFQFDTLPNESEMTPEKWRQKIIPWSVEESNDQLQLPRILSSWKGERLHLYCIAEASTEELQAMLWKIIQRGKDALSVVINGYLSSKITPEYMPKIKTLLDTCDQDNVQKDGRVYLVNDMHSVELHPSPHRVDLSQYQAILATRNKARILTYLRTQLKTFDSQSLSPATLFYIQQEIIRETNTYYGTRGICLQLPLEDDTFYIVMSKASSSMYNMMKWLTYFINYIVETETKLNQSGSVVELVNTYINNHFTERITLNEIASVVYLTPGHLSKIYKKVTGQSINQYIINKRISFAKELLQNSEISINEIAARSGFGSSSYFITFFGKVVGMTPKEYRDKQST